jgi:signal transduction histidine kinase
LGYGWESGAAGSGVAYPLFLECDLRGRVLWMSDRTRLALGNNPENLSITIVMRAPLSFSRLLKTGDRVLITASPQEAPTAPAGSEDSALRGLEGNLLRNYFRLQMAERTLSASVRQRKGTGGRLAIRQMERERQRLGRELHTGVGQLLAAIRLQLEVIAAQLPTPPELVQQALDRIGALATDALQQVRSVSERMHPPEWQRLTLESALQQLWEMSGIPQRFQARIHLETLPQMPEQEVKVLFYRAAQEALSNLARHARATRIEMWLRATDDHVELKIEDNGVGFDVARLWAAPASVSSGIGLRSIREQAEAIGGKLHVESGPSGTTLVVTAPLAPVEG